MSRVRSLWMRPSRRVAAAIVLLGVGTWYATGQRAVADARSARPPASRAAARRARCNAVPGSRAQGWLAQGRSEVLARHGIVATSDPLAAQAGVEILRQGGNAIDAAVAAAAVLDVTSQNDTGIGGDLFALVYVARERKLYALNSAGWAPAGWTPEFFTKTLGVKAVPRQRRQRGHRAGRGLRLRRPAEALRHDELRRDLRAGRPHRRRRLGAGRTPAWRSAA